LRKWSRKFEMLHNFSHYTVGSQSSDLCDVLMA
jgi:hypothetical protein